MMKLEDCFSDQNILNYLCKARANYARRRSKIQLVNILTLKPENKIGHTKDLSDDEKLINSIMPPRRKWKKLNKNNRYVDSQKVNNIKSVNKSLKITIDYYKNKFPNEPFILRLNSFINEIKDCINSDDYEIDKPQIIPIKSIEKDKTVKWRPISQFTLRDKIVIGLVSRYLSTLFDDSFLDCSLAFRQTKNNNIHGELPHHEAIRKILLHKQKNIENEWWVAECDIKKFYDSVNHTIIRKEFKKVLRTLQKINNITVDQRAINLFYKYLDCYNFYSDVYLKNFDLSYKSKFNMDDNSEFKWIMNDLLREGVYKRINKTSRIGVPQGGALSGLIANIVLNNADKAVKNYHDEKLGYYRYCDDIIIFHPQKEITDFAIEAYKKALTNSRLIYHDFKSLNTNEKKTFWENKSKSTYLWTSNPQEGMEWVGFLGYEIRYNNETRVREKSINKEKEKQVKVVQRIYKAMLNGKRKSNETIIESVSRQLIGMAVGRVEYYNYKQLQPDMCWANGFKEINENKYSRNQLRELDRNRQKQLSWFKKKVTKNGNARFFQNRQFVPEHAFTQIKGVTKEISVAIREHLKVLGIIDQKYSLIPSELNEKSQLLDEQFSMFNFNIILVLENITKSKNRRYVDYYGKPYSYYYQVLKKKNL
ncbi:MAG TPA: reverse transcriptase/maturase family protein [Candidatus Paceibacterota bacterium]